MFIELTEDVFGAWCPKGTKGKLIFEAGIIKKFFPDPLPEGCPWKEGIYIGGAKYKELST